MFAARSGNAQGGLLLLTVFAALMAPGSGYAYTPEQQQACTGDAAGLPGIFPAGSRAGRRRGGWRTDEHQTGIGAQEAERQDEKAQEGRQICRNMMADILSPAPQILA